MKNYLPWKSNFQIIHRELLLIIIYTDFSHTTSFLHWAIIFSLNYQHFISLLLSSFSTYLFLINHFICLFGYFLLLSFILYSVCTLPPCQHCSQHQLSSYSCCRLSHLELQVETLPFGICECFLVWKWGGLCGCNQLKVREWIVIQCSCILIRTGDTEIDVTPGKMM